MNRWSREMQASLRRSRDLLAEGLMQPDACVSADSAARALPIRAPRGYAERIKSADDADPIWRTIIPTAAEAVMSLEELADPIGDEPHSPVPCVVHRHRDRVLLKPTLACAVYCRFCFRRDSVGNADLMPKWTDVLRALDYIGQHTEIWEVILTGGDPLILSDARLEDALTRLRCMSHVKVVRIHTRVPIVLPSRVTPELIRLLRGSGPVRQPVWVVVHANHSQELNDEVEAALSALADAGIPLLNQSVLLRGINDSPEELEALCRRLIQLRVKPYYLHHADLARGTGHFRTSFDDGVELMRSMRRNVSGICQPMYVLDIPGGYGKVPLDSSFVRRGLDGKCYVQDHDGKLHAYPPFSENETCAEER
jgi:lysine 2,3-aminomutase